MFAQVRRPANTLLYFSAELSPRSVLNVVLPWIATLVIVAVVAVACRFAEDHPRRDEPPDTGEDDRVPGLLALS